MSKVSLERAAAGVIAGLTAALIVSLIISLIAPLVAGILSVQIAGGNRKRSVMIGAITSLIWGVYAATPFLSGSLVSLGIFGITLSLILGIIGGLIANRFFKNNEVKAETPLSFGSLFKNKIVKILTVVIIIAVIVLAILYYIGVQKLTALFFSPAQIDNVLEGSWTATATPHAYGYTYNGKYYNSGVTANFGYNNMLMVVEMTNYSNATSASLSYTNDTRLIGILGLNSTKTYEHNGTSQGLTYSFYNGTYEPFCVFNCNNYTTSDKISEVIALKNTYVVTMLVYNSSITQNQATQLAGTEFSVLNASG